MDPRFDLRNAEEHAAIAAALEPLPASHPARLAYAQHADTIALTHLVIDRPEIVQALVDAYLAGHDRTLRRHGGRFKPHADVP